MRVIFGFCLLIIIGAGVLLGFRLSESKDHAQATLEPIQKLVVASEEPVVPEDPVVPEEPIVPEDPVVSEEPVPSEPSIKPADTERVMQIERIDERSIRVDDRFILRGSGTQRDPYVISWEYLASANESIEPAKGKTEPAAHIQALDSTWVQIDGYYSSPLTTDEVEEVLLTLNRWDGCCIGLPPTPFDCIETGLREPINLRSKHLIRFGTVTGRMNVEPFVIGNWLMGLYRLEDATLDVGSM